MLPGSINIYGTGKAPILSDLDYALTSCSWTAGPDMLFALCGVREPKNWT